MIITRTPFRISFFGGGTDYPIWYKENGGSVLSTSINKYCYLTCRYLPPFFPHKHRIVYSKTELPNRIAEIDHPSVRETLRFLKWKKGIDIMYYGDLPHMSGMGSSSSFTVGLLHALYGLRGEIKTKRQLALEAIHIEQNLIKESVGSQDQTVAAFGGFNKIEFGGPQTTTVTPLTIAPGKKQILQNHLIMFFTGFSRKASEIAKEQIKKTPEKEKELKIMGQMVDKAINILNSRTNISEFGRLLHESWMIKKSLTSKVSSPEIDQIYQTGLSAGALGGKLLGAGGGGFILFFAKPEIHPKLKEKFKKLVQVPFTFENFGSQIIYYSPSKHF